jgi:hypothetical protein
LGRDLRERKEKKQITNIENEKGLLNIGPEILKTIVRSYYETLYHKPINLIMLIKMNKLIDRHKVIEVI